ncbi:hypothetical protein FACS1894199_17460 [Bacteroidia bacterium]|nr:hypothetical protein FACS1894199_17460 [Bacteroidia bacterium]
MYNIEVSKTIIYIQVFINLIFIIMRKTSYVKVALMGAITIAGVMMTGCGGNKQVASNVPTPKGGNPFGGETYELPCAKDGRDTDEFFGAVGIASGSKERMDELQLAALANAQAAIRPRLKNAYKGTVSDFTGSLGDDSGTNRAVGLKRAGDIVIDQIIDNTTVSCGPRFTAVDEKGNLTCYVAIRISKEEVVDKVAKRISRDKELQIKFDEQQYRKQMQETLKKYKEEQQ